MNPNLPSSSRTSASSSPLSRHIPCGCSEVGVGRAIGILRRLPDHLEVLPIGSRDGEANRDTAAVGEDAPFGADLPAVGRIRAHRFPPKRGFGHRAIHGQPRPIIAFSGLVFNQAIGPQRQEDPRQRPFLGAAMGGTTGTEASLMQRVPLTPGTQDEENGLHGLTLINVGSMTPQRCSFRGGSSRWRRSHHSLAYVNHDGLSLGRDSLTRLLWQRCFANRIPSKQPTGIGSKEDVIALRTEMTTGFERIEHLLLAEQKREIEDLKAHEAP